MRGRQENAGRVALAVILIGLGVVFLVRPNLDFGALWPFFVIIPGAVFWLVALTGGRDVAALAVPGTIIGGTGLILLYQNITNDWESWTFIWALYPVFVGIGLTYMGMRTNNKGAAASGRWLILGGLAGLVVFWAFFRGLSGVALPLILIAAGLWMLLRGGVFQFGGSGGSGSSPKPKRDDDVPIFTGAPVVNARRDMAPPINDDLRRKIDEALAEEDEPEVPVED